MQVHESLAIDEPRRRKCWQTVCPNYLSVLVYLVSMLIVATTVGLLVFNFALCPKEHIVQTLRYPPDHESLLNQSRSQDDQNDSRVVVQPNNRLPRSVIPVSYDIRLIPFLTEGNFSFNGDVTIRVKILEDCFNITLHTLNLRILRNDVLVRQINPNSTLNRVIPISRHEPIEAEHFYILHFHKTLRKDTEYEIDIRYVGKLNDNLVGFYLSSYEENGKKRYIASTQFQPTDARQAFPCFDEPALKATFNITIGRPKTMSSISNMPKVIGEPKEIDYLPDYVWDVFEQSVPMSTYLVAFAVTDFRNLSNGNFTVWARSEGINAAKHALDIGPKILKFLEQFFDIPYPLPKMDMIALPDFSAGAMENWGLLTFRETAMLYEPRISATGIKQRVATVIAHELAHQWFGNLVTPSWWTDLWLNEGFASYMEYIGVQAIKPEWKPMDQFVIHELHNVFILDALSSSHRISSEVTRPEEINEIFDRISYAKGASIIRMMSHFLTFDVFRRGLTNYLRKMSYDSAEQDDLWQFLTKEGHKSNILPKSMNVKEIMDTWTLQVGFPVLHVTRGDKNGTLKLEQKRFSYAPLPDSNEPEPLWWIPLTYTTSTNPDFNKTETKLWMKRSKTIVVEDVNLLGVEWYLFNIQQTGFYRVQYDEANWKAIVAHLRDPARFKQIASSNRAQLIDDVMNFARAGMLSYKTAMDMTLYLEHEDDYIPWKAAVNALYFIDTMFMKEGEYDKLQKYLLRLLTPTYTHLGFDESRDESNLLNIYKRMDILTTACHLGYKDCIRNCNQQFHVWMTTSNPDQHNPISPNLRNVVYCNAIRYGTEEEWDFAFERYTKSTVSSEQELILSALGCSREMWILNRYLESTLNEKSGIRKQDLHKVFSSVSNNVIGQPIAFGFIRRHFDRLKQYIGENVSNLNQMIKQVVHQMNTEFELDELTRFIEKHYGNATRSLLLQQSIERVQVNIEWMNRNYASILEWLREEVGNA